MTTNQYQIVPATGATTMYNVTTSGTWMPTAWQPPQPEKKQSRLDKILEVIRSERGGSLPMIAGGSPDSETEIKVEQKKKVVLKRSVGVTREKGGTNQEIHKGSVELVRDMAGNELQRSTIGIKASPEGNSYVEIPIDKIVEALVELDAIEAPKAKKNK